MVTSLFDIGFANCCKGNITVNNKLVRPGGGSLTTDCHQKLRESNGSICPNPSHINLLRVAQFAQIHWLTLVQNWWLTLVQIIH